ncbi:MAG: hypothetical protein AAF242_00065 [Bacteroidota bacterium]
MFNSSEYAWKDVSINLLGRTVIGVEEIKYKESTEKEYLYGRGSQPRGIQSGNKKYEGKLVLHQSEYDAFLAAIKAADPSKGIQDVSVDVVVSYGNGNDAKTDIVQAVQFTEAERGMAQNDKQMKIELPFLALGVKAA